MGSNENKKEKNKASFFIKVPDGPLITSAEAQRSEQELLAKYKTKGPRAETLKPLAIFYSRVGQQDKAYQYLKLWLKHAKNNEEIAESLLMSGQLAEQVEQYETAIKFYRQGLKYKHYQKNISYFLNNNLAFCLNELGFYQEAMPYCEAAIQLDNTRSNSYKNFGVSLAGVNQLVEAANIWIKAIHIDVSDERSLTLLENLLSQHGEEIRRELPTIDEQISECKHAVASAKTGRFADWARGLTLN